MDAESIGFWVLLATCLVHWLTVFVLFHRGRLIEKPLGWNLLGLAVGLLAIQQTYVLYNPHIEQGPPALNFVSAAFGLFIAGLLLGGIVWLAPLLHLLQRNKELLAVIEERNVVIHQFHERIARALQKLQIAMEVGKPVNFIIEQVAGMSHMLQNFLEDLKAGVLLGSKFEVALKTLVEDLNRDASFPITVHVDSSCEGNISRAQGVEFLHILREALHNSLQYSQAKKGHVSVKMTATDMVLEVSDNGKGFEVDLVRAQGHGLGNMVQRAKKIGARLIIHSQLNRGTSVFMEVPLNRKPSNGNHSVSSSHSSSDATRKVPVS
jgi:two-component sensor histidine kinase